MGLFFPGAETWEGEKEKEIFFIHNNLRDTALKMYLQWNRDKDFFVAEL